MRIIAGTHRRKEILSPKGQQTRPTSSQLRESLFNICQAELADSIFLDLCAGSGAMGLEALSRGASRAIFVENHPLAIRCIKQNIKNFSFESQSEVWSVDASQAIHRLAQRGIRIDLAYIDPPYDVLVKNDKTLAQSLLEELDQSNLLSEGARVFLEHPEGNRFNWEALTKLRFTKERRAGKARLLEFDY